MSLEDRFKGFKEGARGHIEGQSGVKKAEVVRDRLAEAERAERVRKEQIELRKEQIEIQKARLGLSHGIEERPDAPSVEEFEDWPNGENDAIQYLPWSKIHDSIMMAEVADGEWGGESMQALAKRLRTDLDELQGLKDAVDPSQYALNTMNHMLELEDLKKRGFNWDRIEGAALNKLHQIITTKRVTLAETLAIARTANVAMRRGSSVEGDHNMNQKGGPGGNNNGVNVNIFGSGAPGAEGGGLPGPGSLGTITLSLSQRTVAQLGQGKVIEGEKLSDSIELLGVNDIHELNLLTTKKEDLGKV